MAEPEFTTEELKTEEWRPVVNYETFYEVSDLGRVRTTVTRHHSPKGLILKPQLKGRRYADVSLSRPRERCTRRPIHVMVAEAFIGPRPSGHEVNHEDGVKFNNRLSNLEYLTKLANNQHATANGLRPRGTRNGRYTHPEAFAHQRGENINTAKMTAEKVKELRREVAANPQGVNWSALGRKYNIAGSNAKKIASGQYWKHLS